MDNDRMQRRNRRNDELARRLAAYAEARLSPEPTATTRMRAHVMAVAHHRTAIARAGADRAAATAALAAADRTRRPMWRRPFTALLAAGLTLVVGVGSVAAAQPGGPLYGTRIWAETLTLPANANERAQAELRRLEERLSEAAAATAAGDVNAANAALDAYSAIVNEATHDVGNDVAAAATLNTGVRSNIDVLRVLVDRFQTGHGQAGEAIHRALQRAIDRSDSALDELHGKPSDTPGGQPAANPTKNPDATDRPGNSANPNRLTPKPANSTAKPHPTPRRGPPIELPGGGSEQQDDSQGS